MTLFPPNPLPPNLRAAFKQSQLELADLEHQWQGVRQSHPDLGDLAEATHHLHQTITALNALLNEEE